MYACERGNALEQEWILPVSFLDPYPLNGFSIHYRRCIFMFLCSCICWPHRFLYPVYLNSFRSECSKNIRVIFSEYDFVLEEAYFSISSWRVHMYLCINWHHNIENCFNLSVLVMNSLLCKVFWHSGWVLLQFFKHRNLPFFFSKFWQHICKGYGIFFGLFACTFLTFFSPFLILGWRRTFLHRF